MKANTKLFVSIGFLLIILSTPVSVILNPIENELNQPENADSTQIDYLIISYRFFTEEMDPLANWKTQKGLTAEVINLDDIVYGYEGRDTPEKIKNCIIDYYNNHGTQWVLLAGDAGQVPTREANSDDDYSGDGLTVSCDSYYSDLTNSWNEDGDLNWGENDDDIYDFNAEVFVGRLCADDDAEMTRLVQNIIDYETNPPEGDWFSKGLYGGSILTYDTDWEGDNIPEYTKTDNNRFNHWTTQMMDNNSDIEFDHYYLAETAGLSPSNGTLYPYNDTVSEDNLVDALNEGYGFGMMTGHGWPQGMVRTIFSSDTDGDGCIDYDGSLLEDGVAINGEYTTSEDFITTSSDLDTDNKKLGMYYLGGCSVGTFDDEAECLTEFYLKTCAIGVIGGSQVVWGEDEWYERDHGGWHTEGFSFRFFEQLLEYNSPGQAMAYAKSDYYNDTLPDHFGEYNRHGWFPEWEDKMLKQNNLLGDPEVPIWLDSPNSFDVNFTEESDSRTLLVEEDDAGLENVLVTITEDNALIWEGLTDSSGEVTIPYTETELNVYNLTVYKQKYLPYQEISYVPETDDDTDDDTTDDTTDDDDGVSLPGFSIGLMIGSLILGTLYIITKKNRRA